MIRTMCRALVVVAALAFSQSSQATCSTEFIDLLGGIDWKCIFPMSVGGLTIYDGGNAVPADPDNVGPIVCACTEGSIPRFGVSFNFWEPARLIDTVKDPYCFASIGMQLDNAAGGTLGGRNGEEAESYKTFAQFHYYVFPVWSMLDLFTDIPCIEQSGFDVAMISEVLPSWNNDLLSLLINPEAVLFANPAADLSCLADAASAGVYLPLDQLFWCMGSWGTSYPLAGNISNPSYVEANAALAARSIYFMARTNLLLDPGVNACSAVRTPIWRKRNYRLQETAPVRGSCQPIGKQGLTWSSGKNKALSGDNFSWLMFRKNKCCITY